MASDPIKDYNNPFEGVESVKCVNVRVTDFPVDSLEYQLEKGIQLLQERRKKSGDKYQDVYKQFGVVLLSLFPEGIHIEPNDTDKAIKLGIIVQKVTKLTRYCAALDEGGHLDSSMDDMNYSAMLSSVTKVKNEGE